METLGYAKAQAPSPFRWRRWLIVWGIVGACMLLAFLALAAAVAFLPAFQMGTNTDKLATPQIEQMGRFKLPPGASGIRSNYTAFQDFSLHVTFTMPPGSLDQFMRSTISVPCRGATLIREFNSQGPQRPWWCPGDPAKFIAASNDPGDQPPVQPPATLPTLFQKILIDTTNPQQYRVWLLTFDM